jgi:hypothetical protein
MTSTNTLPARNPIPGSPVTRTSLIALALFAPLAAVAADPAKKLTADAVVKQWTPKTKGDESSYGRTGGSPKESPDVAGHTFMMTGMTLEQVWNFYAERCGLEERYKEKHYLIATGTTKAGHYVVSGRPAAGKAEHGESMFLLKAAEYTVTVSFHLDPDGKTVLGSIGVVVK